MALATTRGKEFALEELRLRREKNKGQEHIDDSKLYAGSPMHYYCIACDTVMTLPESHICAAPKLCDECVALKSLGWLE